MSKTGAYGPMVSRSRKRCVEKLSRSRRLDLIEPENLLKLMKSLTFRSFITPPGILALLALCTLGMPAQTPSNPRKDPAKDDQSTIRVNVRLVNVFTTVTDDHGAPVANLAKEDFKVLEDGMPQTISVFDQESELPLNIILAID